MNHIRVRIKESGQVLDMVPDVARAMLAGGTAERADLGSIESQAVEPRSERAVAPAQAGPQKKSNFSRKGRPA